MSPITHLLIGWTTGEAVSLTRRDRAFVALAGLLPDLDGAGILVDFASGTHPSMGLYGEYHHVLGHNLTAAACASLLAFGFAHRRAVCAALVFLSLHLHLLGDLVGSAGPERSIWSLTYLYPFSRESFAWQGQWELNAWPNIAVTVLVLGLIGLIAVRRGRTPVELLSRKADAAVVDALRQRFA